MYDRYESDDGLFSLHVYPDGRAYAWTRETPTGVWHLEAAYVRVENPNA